MLFCFNFFNSIIAKGSKNPLSPPHRVSCALHIVSVRRTVFCTRFRLARPDPSSAGARALHASFARTTIRQTHRVSVSRILSYFTSGNGRNLVSKTGLRSSPSFSVASFLGARLKGIFLCIKKKKEEKSRRHVVTPFDLRFLFVRRVILYAAANNGGKLVILFAFLTSTVKSFIALTALFFNVFG